MLIKSYHVSECVDQFKFLLLFDCVRSRLTKVLNSANLLEKGKAADVRRPLSAKHMRNHSARK